MSDGEPRARLLPDWLSALWRRAEVGAAPGEQALRAALQDAETAARRQSDLFSDLSHELRTPLTAILGYADLLRRSGLSAEQSEHLDTLDKSARGLLGMINDLLDWNRIEADGVQLQQDRFDLADLVEDMISMLAPLAYEKRLDLVHQLDADLPPGLLGDAQRLRQILTNLLSNAIKFTESGEVVLRIARQREDDGRLWLRCSVSDTGVGLSAEQQQRMFEPFRQFDTRQRQAGSGLGLVIVKRLTELMGGQISVDSAPGAGSTFTVVVAFGIDDDVPPNWERLRGRQLWLLEPQQSARTALSQRLDSWGVQTRSFDSAAALLPQLRDAAITQRPEAIIAGLQPWQLEDPAVAELAGFLNQSASPLLVLLASMASQPRTRALGLGASSVLPKSVGRLRLYRELCTLLMHPTALALSGKRLLIADDDAASLQYLKALVEQLGALPLTAIDGGEALRLWQSQPFDFALLDLRMPGLDGAAAIRAIRAGESGGRRGRIVAMSASLAPGERQTLLLTGADEVLLKPFDESQLLRSLIPTPNKDDRPTGVSARLASDPELLGLLREELPLQLLQLEQAFDLGDAGNARNAAHTLHGTAAFYHLSRLRSAARDLEQKLAETGFRDIAEREVEQLRTIVDETLAAIQPA